MQTAAFAAVIVCGLLWLAVRRPRARRWHLLGRPAPLPAVTAIDRQHRHLQAGGMLGERACERAKNRFRELLDAGRRDCVERELAAGLDFAVSVRALADLGTPAAVELLERQLARTHSTDATEQAWYWADLAAALRRLNRESALPGVLRCADAAADLPSGALLAAEAVAFPNFAALLQHPEWTAGRAALRALVTTARAARAGGLDLAGVVRAGLGDKLADAARRAEGVGDPWLVLVAVEAERAFRRFGAWSKHLPVDARALAEAQALRLWATGDRRRAWLASAPDALRARFLAAPDDERAATARALCELRADAARLFPHLPDVRSALWADAVRALRWSAAPTVGPVLAAEAVRHSRWKRGTARAAVLLGALRGHACYESEAALLRSLQHTDARVRCAALGALGHWNPFDPNAVVPAVRAARANTDPAERRAAVGALARLGDRSALDEIASGLRSEEPAARAEAATRAADEHLTWLWPDLETVACEPDADAALAATEALEVLRENIFGLCSAP
jgi:hypothetical protein